MNKLFANWNKTYNEFPRTFWIVVTTVFIDRLGGSLLFPFFALYITAKFGVSMIQVGYLFGIFAVTGLIGGFIGGALTDRIGRKKMIMFSLIFSSLSTVAMGFISTIEAFYLFAMISGIFSSIGGPAHEAILADILKPEKRAEGYGIIRVVFNLAVIIGPVVGGLVATRLGYMTLFITDAIISIISATIVFFAIPETKPEPHAGAQPETMAQTFGGYGTVLRDTMYMFFLFAILLQILVYVNMNTTLGVFLRDFHGIAEDGYAYILSINAAMVVFFQFPITRRIEKFPPMLVMAAGTMLYAMGFTMYGFTNTYAMFVLAMVIITIGEMLVSPVAQALVASFAPEHMRGRYMAFTGMTWGISFGIGPLLAGVIMETINPNFLWYACGIVGSLSVVAFLALHRVHPATEMTQPVTESASPA